MRLKYIHVMLFAIIAFIISGCDSADNLEKINPGITNISVTLSGAQVVPAQTTNATATAALKVSDDGVLTGFVTVTGLASGNSVGSLHLHLGNPGLSGDPIFSLAQDSTVTNRWNVPENSTFSTSQLSSFLAGGTYLNVHTTNVGLGELRGQVLPANYEMVMTTLSGDQQLTAVTTIMTGKAYSLINTSTGKLITSLMINDATNVQSSHIHKADPGIAKQTAVDTLVENAADANLYEVTTNLSAEDKAAYMAGGLYINVHTTANQGGELRGQILPAGFELVITELSGDNVVPIVDSILTARAFSLVDTTINNMKVNVNMSDAGDVTKIHVHMGEIGVSGAPISELTSDSADLNLYQTSFILDSQDMEDYLAGDLYINVHTSVYSNGELRGQIQP